MKCPYCKHQSDLLETQAIVFSFKVDGEFKTFNFPVKFDHVCKLCKDYVEMHLMCLENAFQIKAFYGVTAYFRSIQKVVSIPEDFDEWFKIKVERILEYESETSD